LPKIGYIAYIGKTPVAAGFLRRLEPCYGQIDTLTSSALFGSQIRHKALESIVNELENEAKRLKIVGLICHTKDAGILSRAQSIGYHVVPETIIAKLIGT